jgi:hypothetical protein
VNMNAVITFLTALYTFFNIIRAIYALQATRYVELENVIKDAVQHVWDSYTKERKEQGVWNNVCKIKATELAESYVKKRIRLVFLVNDQRLRRLIKEQVEYRKLGRKEKILNKI